MKLTVTLRQVITRYRQLIGSLFLLLLVIAISTTGYWIISDGQSSLIDCFYMTSITITTIGYGEIVDLSHHPFGRLFTVGVAFSGVGLLTYTMSQVAAIVVDGYLTGTLQRRKMESEIARLTNHYLICSLGHEASYILKEMTLTGRPCVIVDASRERIQRVKDSFPDIPYVEGDPTDNDILLKAGLERASGVFAVDEDDSHNLVISLTARQLNPNLRIVARCANIKNVEKVRKAGADSVISPEFTGGLRMASEMVRPAVVSFLDTMLRDRDRNLRIEEIQVPASRVGTPLSSLPLSQHHDCLLMAVKHGSEWTYNPPDDFLLPADSQLILMTPATSRQALEAALA